MAATSPIRVSSEPNCLRTLAATPIPPFSLALLQCFFLLTWVVYVVYLPDLVADLGWPAHWVPRLLLLDQLLFALADVVLGRYGDRVLGRFGRFAPFVLTLNLVSCVAFVALPYAGLAGAGVFLALTVVWLVTSAVLRAPLYGLIAQRAAGQGNVALLLGMGVASALSPYLGQVLKTIDPGLVFALSGIALALATLAFSRQEPDLPSSASQAQPDGKTLKRLVLAMLFLGLGFQMHFFVNAAPLFKAVAPADSLPWLMPVFWIGFSLAVYPGSGLIDRLGPGAVLARAAWVGAGASLVCLVQPALPVLLGLQLVAGAAWGLIFLSALGLAGQAGRSGRESTYLGLLFASLAVAAAVRIGLGWKEVAWPPELGLPLAAAAWVLGAVLAWHSRAPITHTRSA